jgi:hypothetical protein
VGGLKEGEEAMPDDARPQRPEDTAAGEARQEAPRGTTPDPDSEQPVAAALPADTSEEQAEAEFWDKLDDASDHIRTKLAGWDETRPFPLRYIAPEAAAYLAEHAHYTPRDMRFVAKSTGIDFYPTTGRTSLTPTSI